MHIVNGNSRHKYINIKNNFEYEIKIPVIINFEIKEFLKRHDCTYMYMCTMYTSNYNN